MKAARISFARSEGFHRRARCGLPWRYGLRSSNGTAPPGRFLLVCNAGPRAGVWSWLKAHATDDVVLTDRTLEGLCVALQGPRAPELLQRFTSVDLSRIKPFAGVMIDFVPPAPWGAHP